MKAIAKMNCALRTNMTTIIVLYVIARMNGMLCKRLAVHLPVKYLTLGSEHFRHLCQKSIFISPTGFSIKQCLHSFTSLMCCSSMYQPDIDKVLRSKRHSGNISIATDDASCNPADSRASALAR